VRLWKSCRWNMLDGQLCLVLLGPSMPSTHVMSHPTENGELNEPLE
jgi:hypothetical protein